jgi:hypothetical protein
MASWPNNLPSGKHRFGIEVQHDERAITALCVAASILFAEAQRSLRGSKSAS